ncbi:heavy metal-associated isoprenylated plant protein 16-like [Tasmannia lanceolata]|uniref:heavy metal-associated isoprenylated plant protein 16-like n=1 Tax=Tasmannia lanceolata TaxID=3420 RepID=UPI0040637A37
MMKQKAVIKLQVHDQKDQKKAMKIAVGVKGVFSASFEGDDKSKIAVLGEGTDAIVLTTSLRKKMGFAELISVGPAEEKKEEKKEVDTATVWAYQTGVPPSYVYQYQVHEPNHDPCSIM